MTNSSSSKNYYKIFDTRLSTVRVEKPLYDNGFEAYQDKLLLSAEHYHNQGIICFPPMGNRFQAHVPKYNQ